MAQIINKIDAATAPFVGQGDLIIFGAVSDYSTAKLSDFSSPQSLGQIVQDSTTALSLCVNVLSASTCSPFKRISSFTRLDGLNPFICQSKDA